MTSLKKKAVSGIKWVFVGNIAQKAISFVGLAILARILDPADFGLFSLAFIMINALGLFKSMGFDSALIRRTDDFDKAANTAFFLIPSMGVILFLILLIIAPMAASSLGNSSVTNVIRTLGIIFVISCFGKVPQASLYRDMKFKYKYISEILSKCAYILAAIILALKGFGVWSLVAGYILKVVIESSVQWYYSGWKPKFEFDKKIAGDMFRFGKYIFIGSIVAFLYGNLDNIVVGKFLGVTVLGYYAIARSTSRILNDYFLGKTGQIMYPAYSKIQNDQKNINRILLKTLSYISIIAFPFSIGLFVFAPDILRVIFGEKWLPATDVLRILAVVALFRSLIVAMGPAFLAKGQSKVEFQIGFVQVVIFFALVIPFALSLKLIGVGYALLISTIISFCIALVRAKMILHIKISQIFESTKQALACSLLMLFVGVLLKTFPLVDSINLNFFIPAVASTLIYFFAIYFVNRSSLIEIAKSFI